ncbi:MAG: VCBS repeat-containing protein [Planctomycetes bacterium]|nr:VCBS repeat-containing protein [Planctomycetota bacterium]
MRAIVACAVGLLVASRARAASPDDVAQDGPAPPAGGERSSAVLFVEVPAEDSGIAFVHHAGARGVEKRFMIECVGAGLGLVDLDGDGDLDLYCVQGADVDEGGRIVTGPRSRDALFLNDGGLRFSPSGAGVDLGGGHGSGVCAADVDGDGDDDLFVTNLGFDELLLNDGAARLSCAPGASGAAGAETDWSMGAAFADADADGDLDLYVARYHAHDLSLPMLSGHPCTWLGCEVPCGPQGLPAQADAFFVNDGRGAFVERTSACGMALPQARYGFQPVFGDFDGDGDADLFVSNDSVENSLFVNEGRGDDGLPHFDEQGMRSGLALSDTGKAQAGMGVAVADLDGDLDDDVVMTNFAREVNACFVNASNAAFGPLFFDEGNPSGLGRPSYFDLGWGCNVFDADLDGDVDVFVANGHVYPHVQGCNISSTSFAQLDRVFLQLAPGRFAPPPGGAGPALDVAAPSRGSAAGDLDGDGDVDLVVAQLDGAPRLLRNESRRAGRFVLLDLRPLAAAVGARVTVEAEGTRRAAEVRAGSSFLCTEDRRLHFGLPPGEGTLTVHVRWPDGLSERFTELPSDGVRVLVHGTGQP